ncbi:N-acetyltransferase [Azospirillum brasilense]|uniref:GNAT family protein n=1 Tax=Azospirillum brasilense TaxID=192 RepID=A0A0P0EHX8_AZOBR|nr:MULTISPECIES: GNAT family protein [Azospirillum]ALJ37541.1 acetyltransferase [Azospirillum brasilense]MDW7553739.1 GNAT family protein [Azospirillum brasilense]MDW7592822.1 GNAT family protein [Azospirillum brasilense]MDW7628353.1 GNAT family protein [Azospirillum brasilense]MDX5952292.1 GNAT family protein [Azospirillum brasilense]
MPTAAPVPTPAAVFSHRPLTDADIPHICRFARNREELYFLFPRATWPLTPEQVRASLAVRRDPTVVLRGGEVVGYANFATFEEGCSASLGNVSAAPWVRRTGVAKHLVRIMMDRAFDHHGLPELVLRCFNTNTPGLLLYAAMGFVPIAIEERTAPWGDRLALLTLRIDRARWDAGRGEG